MASGGRVLGLAIALAGLATVFSSPQLTSAFLGGGGFIPISNDRGTSSVTGVVLQMPTNFADSVKIPSPQGGWAVQQAGTLATLSGGSLQPRQNLSLQFNFTKYFPPGNVTILVNKTFAQGGGSVQDKAVIRVYGIGSPPAQVVTLVSNLGLPAAAGSGLLILVFALQNIAFRSRPKVKGIKPSSTVRIEIEGKLEGS